MRRADGSGSAILSPRFRRKTCGAGMAHWEFCMSWVVRRVGADEFFGVDKIYARSAEDALPFASRDDAIEMQRACSDADMLHFYEIEEVFDD